MMKLFALMGFFVSLGANAALVTYTATEADVTEGLAGITGSFTYDTYLQQATSYDLRYSDSSYMHGDSVEDFSLDGEALKMLALTFNCSSFLGCGQHSLVEFEGKALFYFGANNEFEYSGETGAEAAFHDVTYYPLGNVGGAFYTTQVVPIPAAAWLFGSALMGLMGVARRKRG